MDLEGLNPAQLEAVVAEKNNLLVVAGPGSGKTRVLTYRAAHLVSKGTPASRLLAVTFTNKAAAELRERLEVLMGGRSGVWASTFHSFCVRVVRDQHQQLGVPASFTIVDTSDSERLVREALKRTAATDAPDLKERAEIARQLTSTYQSAISGAKNSMLPMNSSGLPFVDEVAALYQEELTKAGAVDFDDLLTLTERALRDEGCSWRNRFEEVLFDEAQDANPIQIQALKHLHAAGTRITVVGDPDQSIYGFRHASPEGIAGFMQDFSPAVVVPLEQNYRSTQPILDTCRAVISRNEAVVRASPWTADESAAAPVQLKRHDSDRDEAQWVVDQISATPGGVSPETAILVRTLAQTRQFEQALANRRIPYQVVAGVEFYRRAEVQAALAWVRAAQNRQDRISLERASAVPRRGLGKKAFEAILGAFNDVQDTRRALVEAPLAGKAARSAAEMSEMLNQIETAAAAGPAAAIRSVYTSAGLLSAWQNDPAEETRLENLDALLSAAAEFERLGMTVDGRSLAELSPAEQTAEFTAFAALNASVDDGVDTGVQLMTVHAAKGREFDMVFVPGLEERLFPHARSLDSDHEIAEERRLLYVACSRPRKRLILTYAARRFLFGKPSSQSPSRFLRELPAEVTSPRRSKVAPTPQSVRPATPSSAPGPRAAASDLSEGVVVEHTVFGRGSVVSVSGDTVVVRFESRDRTLSLRAAPMSVVVC